MGVNNQVRQTSATPNLPVTQKMSRGGLGLVSQPYPNPQALTTGPLQHWTPPPSYQGSNPWQDPVPYQERYEYGLQDAEIHNQREFYAKEEPLSDYSVKQEPDPDTESEEEEEAPDSDWTPEKPAAIGRPRRSARGNTNKRARSPDTEEDEETESSPVYVPKTKARKYKLKNSEDKDEAYRLKRARNNDAVRKSRRKQKEREAITEKESEEMAKRIKWLEAALKEEKAERAKEKEFLKKLLAGQFPPQEAPGPEPASYYNQPEPSTSNNRRAYPVAR